ncbi:hypothetical protein HY500_00350 [Candidatus Woesearchaeota archaeon]|nr:hypothetical protein [Candidatus Woesearchaeota archaeon]
MQDKRKDSAHFVKFMLEKASKTENVKANTSSSADIEKVVDITKKIMDKTSISRDARIRKV